MAETQLKRRIREQWEVLVQDLRPIGPYCDVMFARQSMSRETYERITSERISFDQSRKFLHYLITLDDAVIQAFIRKLDKLQPHLASRTGLSQEDVDGHLQVDNEATPTEDRASNLSHTPFVVDGASSTDDLAEPLSSTREDLGAPTMQQMKSDPHALLDQRKSSKKYPRVHKVLEESAKDMSKSQETAFMTKTREDAIGKLQDCQRVLTELKSGSTGCTGLTGKALKDMKTGLCQMLDIDEAKWIDEQKPIDKRYDNFYTDITQVLRTSKETPSILDIFVNASAGLALGGILHLVGCSDNPKQTVLSAPRKIKVTKPLMHIDCLVREFTSKGDCDLFFETLDTLGCSVAASPKVNSCASLPQNQENEGEVPNDCSFYSQVVCYIHATAACPVDPNDLEFTPEVLGELNKIGEASKKQTRYAEGIEDVDQTCMEFLETFGSHVNTGLLHMGGVKRFVGAYSGIPQPLNRVRSLVKHALSGYIRMSHSGLLCSDTAKTSAEDLKTVLNIPKPYDEFDLSHISLQTSNNGGPDVANLPVWKIGLSVNRKSLALIDRCLPIEHTAVWDLIPNREDFDVPIQIASCLQTSWEKVIDVPRPLATASKLYEVESLLDSWASDPMFLEHCQEHLSHLLFVIEELFRETGSYGFWEYVLSPRKSFREFLTKVETEEQFPIENQRFIRYTLKRIRSAGCQTGLQSGLDHEAKSIPVTITTITDVQTLLTTLKEKLIPSLKSIFDFRSVDACVTVELAVAISHLLQSTSSPLESLLLKISLFQVQYHHKQMTFGYGITIEKLEEFCNVVEGNWNKFSAVKEVARKEAFLIHLLLTSPRFQMDSTRKEVEFNRIIKDAKHEFSHRIRDVLDSQRSSQVQWSQMITMTQQIASGKVAAVHHESGMDNTSNLNPFEDLLEELGLSEYYPNGITWRQATVIKTFPEELEKTDIPWKLLNGLLMLDYHSRDQVPSEAKGNLQKDGQSFDFEIENFLNASCSACDGETELHPLDVLLTTFLCCDGILRQKFAHNLSVCKLAIPFFYFGNFVRQPTMSLWALRTIVLEWYDQQQKGQDAFASELKLPIVSFVRMGRPSASKSRIANCLLRDDSHTTFYCSKRESDTDKKLAADGMVECSWFLPANNEKALHTDPCLLLNLRGDAVGLEEQVQVLQVISAVVVVVINFEDLEGKSKQSLVQLCRAAKGVFIFLTTEAFEPEMQKIRSNWRSLMSVFGEQEKEKMRQTVLPRKRGFEAKQKSKVCKDLSEMLQDGFSLSLNEVANVAAEHHFLIDEREPGCTKGGELAREVAELIKDTDLKQGLLPLQCHTWIEYSSLERQLHQTRTPSVGELQKKMTSLRNEQAEACNKLLPACKKFTECLLNTEQGEVNMYFLEWFKILLVRRATKTLPQLKKGYLDTWRKVHEAKKKHIKDLNDEDRIETLEADLSKAVQGLDDASLELNHFFRELGQMYEAIRVATPNIDDALLSRVEAAPEVIAKLLVEGIPVELVDGDASNVPITWVEAILLKLQELLPEKKLFVVSVLGLQSSGKSTLLNTMFGLQFASSAGRCTKGVFMQVIPVNRRDLQMDYIAVLDTEGLRAPELKQVKYNHDNELATLAIGLGDVTLINIMGQNAQEIKDILQMSVHAFLRMKIVSKTTKMHQSCIFIHQNVPSVKAKEETAQSCMTLQDQLDTMTKEAAHQEGLKDIQAFSQIIKFNALENVYYFPGLWYGDPPMAPSNPGYSKNVRSVLGSLLDGSDKEQTTFLTVTDLAVRLRDLWSAILDDDFVFSFRNSLEVKAYNEMSKFYSMLNWELTCSIMNWLQRTADNKIKTCETVSDLDACAQRLLRELLDTTAKRRKVLEQRLVQYFDNNSLKGIMIQWKRNKLNSLANSSEEKITEGRKYLHEVEKEHKFGLLSRSKWSRLENDLMEKAVELATKLGGKLDQDSEMENKFGITWDDWKSNLPTEDQSMFNMEILIQTVLYEMFSTHGQIVQEELNCPTFKKHNESLSLRISVKKEDLEDTDFSFNTSLNGMSEERRGEDLQKAIRLTRGLLHGIDVHLQKLTANERIKFQRAHAEHVIKVLKCRFERWNDGEGRQCFIVLPSYMIRVAVYVGRYCVRVFDKMQEDYERRHGVTAKLKAFKTYAYNFFENTVKNCAEEVTAADLLCNKLKPIVESTVAEEIPRTVADELFTFFAGTKRHLILHMMDDLATMGEFEDFESYITNPTAFAYEWLTKHTNKMMFSRSKDNISRYEELIQVKLESLVKCIVRAAQQATEHVVPFHEDKERAWVSAFCDQVQKSIPVVGSYLEHLEKRQIQDFHNFIKLFKEKLEAAKNELLYSFGRHTGSQTWAGTSPYELLFGKLWGCEECCPFCGEPCDDTTPDHSEFSHHCIQHRPTGVNGYRWRRDEDQLYQKDCLITQTCNYWVQNATMKFSCGGCSHCDNPVGQYHLYREYKRFFPQWDIAPDPTNSVSKYWMWFMATYREDLAKMYSTLPPDVPEEWLKITREEALIDLRRYR